MEHWGAGKSIYIYIYILREWMISDGGVNWWMWMVTRKRTESRFERFYSCICRAITPFRRCARWNRKWEKKKRERENLAAHMSNFHRHDAERSSYAPVYTYICNFVGFGYSMRLKWPVAVPSLVSLKFFKLDWTSNRPSRIWNINYKTLAIQQNQKEYNICILSDFANGI